MDWVIVDQKDGPAKRIPVRPEFLDMAVIVDKLPFDVLLDGQPHGGRLELRKKDFPDWIKGWLAWENEQVAIDLSGAVGDNNITLQEGIQKIRDVIVSHCVENNYPLSRAKLLELKEALLKCSYEPGLNLRAPAVSSSSTAEAVSRGDKQR